jgi:hypothetical protein
MFAISYDQCAKFALAGAIALLTVAGSVRAGDQAHSLGPVGPHEPILVDVGSKRIVAFYLPGTGHCALHAVVWDNKTNADTDTSAARFRVSLEPGQIVHIDSAPNESVNLQCGKNAEKLAIVDTDRAVASGITNEQPGEPIKAGASGF